MMKMKRTPYLIGAVINFSFGCLHLTAYGSQLRTIVKCIYDSYLKLMQAILFKSPEPGRIFNHDWPRTIGHDQSFQLHIAHDHFLELLSTTFGYTVLEADKQL